MGTTVYNRSLTEAEALEEMRRLHTWQAEGGPRYSVIADGIAGSGDSRGYYAAVKIEEGDKAAQVFAAVCLITLSPFSRKEMSENMGPRIARAPRAVLEALTPLPERDPKPCRMCHGSGEFNGRDCFSCDGEGEKDEHDCARRWRRDAWARHGGEPQGKQLSLLEV